VRFVVTTQKPGEPPKTESRDVKGSDFENTLNETEKNKDGTLIKLEAIRWIAAKAEIIAVALSTSGKASSGDSQVGDLNFKKIDPHKRCCHKVSGKSFWQVLLFWEFKPKDRKAAANGTVEFGEPALDPGGSRVGTETIVELDECENPDFFHQRARRTQDKVTWTKEIDDPDGTAMLTGMDFVTDNQDASKRGDPPITREPVAAKKVKPRDVRTFNVEIDATKDHKFEDKATILVEHVAVTAVDAAVNCSANGQVRITQRIGGGFELHDLDDNLLNRDPRP
jgi:hypothetical protein